MKFYFKRLRKYRIVWSQSFGWWSSIFWVEHVEQTHFIGMFLALLCEREKETERVSEVSKTEIKVFSL